MAHQDSWFKYEDHMKNNDKKSTSSSSSSIGEESMVSNGSSSPDTTDDASSSSSSSNSNGSLYDLSEIMAQLPIKRGLSKYYQGKSESFTSLISKVISIEDMAKKARKNMKASKSYGNGLHSYKNYTLPKAIISKKPITRRASCFSSSYPSKRGSSMSSSKSPLPPLHNNLEC